MAIKCIINSIEYELFGQYKIQEKLGNIISTNLSIEVPEGVRIPKAKDIVRVVDDGPNPDEVLFLGVAGIPKSPKYNNFNEVRKYDIKCQNANEILSRRIVNYAAETINLSDVVLDLFNLYMDGEGITLGTISATDVNFSVYVAPDLDLKKVMNELADRAGAIWSLTNDYVFNFIILEDFQQFEEIITESYIFGNGLQAKNTGLDVRTRQIISDATETTDEQTENFLYNGTNTNFNVSFPIIQKPIVEVNSVAVDPSKVGVKGLNDNDPNYYFLFANLSENVSYVDASAFLSGGETVTIKYIGRFPIRIEASNQSRIDEIATATGTSGIIENVISDSSIKNSIDGQTLAESLLSNFEFGRNEVKWTLNSQNLRKFGLSVLDFAVGIQITFDLPKIELEGDYVIVERQIKPLSLNNPRENFISTLKLQDRNFLRSYGESFNALERQVASISVREDQIIVNTLRIEEVITMTEQTFFAQVIEYFPTSSGVGDIFDPGWFVGDGGAFPI